MGRSKMLVRGGLVLAFLGAVLFAIGFGTGLDYFYNQSHPVPASVAFSLKIEYTLAGIGLGTVGIGAVLRGLFSTSEA